MYTYEVEQFSEDWDTPRDWDNLGVIVAWHRRYTIGDIQPSMPPSEWLAELYKNDPSAVVLPVYMYEHGGVTISTSPYGCEWDSGQIGYIYTTLDRVQKYYKDDWRRMTKARRATCEVLLNDEIKIYDQYLRGEVYRYLIKDDDGEIVESGHGYYERDYCESEAQAMIKYLMQKAA